MGCPATGDGALLEGLWRPRGVVATIGEQLFVSDTGQGRIIRVDGTGANLDTVVTGLNAPVLVGVHDSRLLVGVGTDGLISVDPNTGAIETLAGPGTADGSVSLAISAGESPTVAEAGNTLFVAEPANHRVQRFTGGFPSGWIGVGHSAGFELGGACCSAGSAHGEFTEPVGVVIDLAGYLWVLDRANGGRLQRFTLDGDFLDAAPVNERGLPSAIGIAPDNLLWYVSPGDNSAVGYLL
jgi:sugar lactone lactonase YvrE